ncbi:MAG: hypothetical protein QOE72_4339 [Chloroflexota bacterium]|jgi:hypothetical protein|nr:hypothetical protein [Chloroflexota bacterium]
MAGTSTVTDFADAVQEQVTSGIKQAQEINLAAVEVCRDFAALFQPSKNGIVLPSLPKGMPNPTKAIDQVYDFAGKILELQHDYAVRLVEAMTPVVVVEKS